MRRHLPEVGVKDRVNVHVVAAFSLADPEFKLFLTAGINLR
jgi:hypothetical protein